MIAIIMEFPGATKQQYDAVMKDLNLGGKMPSGGLCHIAGPGENGWRVVDVWESQAAFDKFFNDKLRDTMTKNNLTPPKRQVYQVQNSMGIHETVKR
jgi:hypothetical protein